MNQVPIARFEEMYQRDIDPWRFADADYEQRRYDITVAALPARRYVRAFEPGCSVGELTIRLAQRCDRVVAWDGSPSVVAHARRRFAALAHVELSVGEIPAEWPEGSFDLMMLSEIAYYFDPPTLAVVAARAVDSLTVGGTLMAVHWLGHSADHLLHGDEAAEILAAHPDLDSQGQFRDRGFRLDWWERR